MKTFGFVDLDVRWNVKTRGFVDLDVGWNVKTRGCVDPDVRWSVKTRGFVDPGVRGIRGAGPNATEERNVSYFAGPTGMEEPNVPYFAKWKRGGSGPGVTGSGRSRNFPLHAARTNLSIDRSNGA